MIMCVLLCYPVSIRIYYQQCVLFLVFSSECFIELLDAGHLQEREQFRGPRPNDVVQTLQGKIYNMQGT